MSDITFCKSCLNRQFDPERGIICSLTSQKPEFILTCKEFLIDVHQVKSRRAELSHKSNEAVSHFDYIKDILYKKTSRSRDVEIRYSKLKIYLGIFFGFLLLSIMIIPPALQGYWDSLETLVRIVSAFIIMLPVPLFLAFHYLKFAHHKSPIIVLTNKGLTVDGEFRQWKDVIGYEIYKDEFESKRLIGKNYTKRIRFETIGRLSKEHIDVELLDISAASLDNLLDEYLSKFGSI